MNGYTVLRGITRRKFLTETGKAVLAQRWEAGVSLDAICDELGIGRSCVKAFKKRYKLSPRTHPANWIPQEDALLREHWGGLLSLMDIAALIGRSPDGCEKRAWKLGLCRRRSTWPADRTAELIKLKGQGLSYYAIAKRLGITPNAAIGKGTRLGLPKVVRLTQTKAQRHAKRMLKQRERRHGKQFRINFSSKPPKREKLAVVDAPPPLNKSFIENTGCLWSGSIDKHFCGHPRHPKSAYCTGHHAASRRYAQSQL